MDPNYNGSVNDFALELCKHVDEVSEFPVSIFDKCVPLKRKTFNDLSFRNSDYIISLWHCTVTVCIINTCLSLPQAKKRRQSAQQSDLNTLTYIKQRPWLQHAVTDSRLLDLDLWSTFDCWDLREWRWCRPNRIIPNVIRLRY